jgi:hypothetical protein
MTRVELYTAAVACAFADLGAEDRLRALKELERQFAEEYRRAHPLAPPEAASAAFTDLARAISRRMAAR